MLNRSASLAMSTCFLKASPGKIDIKRHSPRVFSFSYFPFKQKVIIEALPSEVCPHLLHEQSLFRLHRSSNVLLIQNINKSALKLKTGGKILGDQNAYLELC